MVKKIILLILVFPLVLMITLFNTTKGIALAVDVAVNKIEITNEKLVYLDMDKGDTHKIDYTVYPTNAKNQKVEYFVEAIDNKDKADVYLENGLITPLSSGSAKVIIKTLDGSYSDSMIVNVISENLKSINLTTTTDLSSIYIGDIVQFSCLFNPVTAINQAVTYASSDANIMQISSSGKATAVSSGNVTITATSKENKNIIDSKTFSIMSRDILDLSMEKVKTTKDELSFYATVSTKEKWEIDYVYDEAMVESFKVEEISTTLQRIDVKIKENVTYLLIEVHLETDSGEKMVKKSEISVVDKINSISVKESNLELTKGSTKQLEIMVDPIDVEIDYVISCLGEAVEAELVHNMLTVKALDYGKANITIKALIRGEVFRQIDVSCVVVPKNITLENLAKTYGIANQFALGKYDFSNNMFVETKYENKYATDKDMPEEVIERYYRYTTSDNSIASVDNKGVLTIKKDGLITLTIGFMIDDIYYKSSSMPIMCVYEGVNVYSYVDLMNTVNANKAVVLHKDIDSDFGVGYTETYKEIETTYDWTYYANCGLSRPKIKVLVEFQNDVYGNGKTINSNNIANNVDEYGSINNSIFKGPLNFVSMTEGETSSLSVKAQDNISFLIRDDVAINNVILKSSNTVSDLTELNNVGTTVEVMGDNVSILNSRLLNGRTVLRIFSENVINVHIESCILSHAREFIMRIGSNKFVDGTTDLPGLAGTQRAFNFKANQNLYLNNNPNSTVYEENYITTFVTVKNCVFEKCGIFSIGMDAHFSGYLLASDRLGWQGCCKTSYGAKLSLEGDVRIYDWKEQDKVDSSTLIENNGVTTSIGDFDIKAIIETLSKKEVNGVYPYATIKSDGYVHGGVAFFGGGKNYSVIDLSKFEGEGFGRPSSTESYYEISLNDCEENISILTAAAGDNPFRFYLYDDNSLFTYKKQMKDIENGEAYSWIPVAKDGGFNE